MRLGATWIKPAEYQDFLFELFETPRIYRMEWNSRKISVHCNSVTGEWSVQGKSEDRSNLKARSVYGTDRANGYKIFEDSLNLRDTRIYDTIQEADGSEKRVLNSEETTLAAQKQQMIKDAFLDWVWKDPERREELTKRYNELFNAERPREYDGSHITFVGMNPEITLREHQRT